MGNAYVAWALKHPGYYAVMWQPRLLDESSQGFSDALTRPADTSALTALVVERLSVANS
ncbi:MAG: WHG domain-containing protein [Salinibacterium sp.]|nr:WHG domain-containing protein [Salinibacterium sp.]